MFISDYSCWLVKIILLLFTFQIVLGKIFNRCDLAKILKHNHNLSNKEIAIWVCIAQRQSGFNSATIIYDSDGIAYHGLFQISDKYWCNRNHRQASDINACDINCDNLRNDDLSDDYQCIRRIYDEHSRISGDGYMAWAAYKNSCRNIRESAIEDCFATNNNNEIKKSIVNLKLKTNKIYHECELARELRYVHNIPRNQIDTWTCIVKHESNFNTSAIGRLNADGSADHGLFQISDIYWCSPPGNGWACGLTCAQLEDDDITDDVECIKIIFDEHQRLSGDGFNAWSVYQPYCKGKSFGYADECFKDDDEKDNFVIPNNQYKPAIIAPNNNFYKTDENSLLPIQKGKIYKPCELARELYFRHKIPMNQIATWVCIAQHESNFNTSAIGRLNVDGSEDHGLFQISDIYWCSPPGNGWVCGVPCSAFEDSDITDDVKCIKIIYDEHQRLSGNGFNAWAVYQPYCSKGSTKEVKHCFDKPSDKDNTIMLLPSTLPHNPGVKAPSSLPPERQKTTKTKGKIYNRCELAIELRDKHKIPIDDISTWVCIAKFESNFNTSAIGRLNADGSEDHGLFQISDIYWCSPPGKGLVCGLTCSELEDSDISDDIECAKKIYDEHTRLSGDGFNAWTVYKPHCQGKSQKYISGCFSNTTIANDVTELNQIVKTSYVESEVGKIYDRCELAIELHFKHNVPLNQISKFVCIAFHESAFNTSAITLGDSSEHGLFQISDVYWCSPPGKGFACGLNCEKLRDSDITDDIQCVQKIYEEHQRLSGDGFNAWQVYQPYCQKSSDHFIESCFDDIIKPAIDSDKADDVVKEKVYSRCELAQELRDKHNIPMKQIATWICIVQYESNFNSSSIVRLNSHSTDDHSLFKTSQINWCSPPVNGLLCRFSCSNLENFDITDDIECMKKMFEEHQRLSGDGFNAWGVYKPYCKGSVDYYVKGCFVNDVTASTKLASSTEKQSSTYMKRIVRPKAKFEKVTVKYFERCELARELRFIYDIPMKQIANWVCIVKYQSQFNTSAIKTFEDGSSHYGLFQIGDKYWCSPPGFGCNLPCNHLLDSNIADDVACAKQIYEAHQLIDGDGFKAWSSYSEFCKDRSIYYVIDCFDQPAIKKSGTKYNFLTTPTTMTTLKPKILNEKFSPNPNNPFFKVTTQKNKISPSKSSVNHMTNIITTTKQTITPTTKKFEKLSTIPSSTTIRPTIVNIKTTKNLKELPTLLSTKTTTKTNDNNLTTKNSSLSEIDYDSIGHLPIKLPGKRVYRNLFDFYLNGFTKPSKITTYPWTKYYSTQRPTDFTHISKNINTTANSSKRISPNIINSSSKMYHPYGSSTKIPFTPSFIQKYIKPEKYQQTTPINKLYNNNNKELITTTPKIVTSFSPRTTVSATKINKNYSSAFDHYFNLFKTLKN